MGYVMETNKALVITLIGDRIDIGCTFSRNTEQEEELMYLVYDWFLYGTAQTISFDFRNARYGLNRNFITSMRILNNTKEE